MSFSTNRKESKTYLSWLWARMLDFARACMGSTQEYYINVCFLFPNSAFQTFFFFNSNLSFSKTFALSVSGNCDRDTHKNLDFFATNEQTNEGNYPCNIATEKGYWISRQDFESPFTTVSSLYSNDENHNCASQLLKYHAAENPAHDIIGKQISAKLAWRYCHRIGSGRRRLSLIGLQSAAWRYGAQP